MEGLVKVRSFSELYKGKKVLVTGHTGFKGSWLTVWLRELGAEVVGYALPPESNPALYNELKVANQIHQYMADVRDYSMLYGTIQKVKPDLIFHLAAQALVLPSYKSPRETFEVNVMGTANVLEATRNTDSVRACVVVTSDKCYENAEWVHAYRENDPMGGSDPYSASKGAAELVVSSFRRSFFNNKCQVGVASARAGNVVGGGDWALDRIVPDCIRALSDNKPILVRNPSAIRPWQHVLEPLSGYLLLGERLWNNAEKHSGAWNFGPDSQSNLSVREIVEKTIATWGAGCWRDLSQGQEMDNKLHEAQFLKLDCTKSHNLLLWRPVYAIDECIKTTTAWYRTFYETHNFNAYEQCLSQIRSYSEAAAKHGIAWASL